MSEFRFYISFWIFILSFSNLILFFKFIKTSLPRLPFPCDEGYMWSLYVCDDTKMAIFTKDFQILSLLSY